MWQVLTAAGGGLALTFIVAISVGVFALTLLYVASAVVVLERFARTARDLRWVGLFGLAVAALAAGGVVQFRWLEGFLGAEEGGSTVVLVAAAASGLATLGSIALCRVALERVSAPVRGTALLLLLASAGAFWLGSTANAWLVATPALVIGALAGLLRWRRLASEDGPGGAGLSAPAGPCAPGTGSTSPRPRTSTAGTRCR